MSDRDELAVALCDASEQHSGGVGHHDAHKWGACSRHEQSVDEILASDWLTALDERVWAEALGMVRELLAAYGENVTGGPAKHLDQIQAAIGGCPRTTKQSTRRPDEHHM